MHIFNQFRDILAQLTSNLFTGTVYNCPLNGTMWAFATNFVLALTECTNQNVLRAIPFEILATQSWY